MALDTAEDVRHEVTGSTSTSSNVGKVVRSYRVCQGVGWALRLIVGAVFVMAAWPKISDPAAFAVAVNRYQILPANLVQAFAILLPWVEVTAAGSIFAPKAWRAAGSVLLGMLLVMFMVAAGSALWRGIDISCGCFSTAEDASPIGAWLFVRNSLLLTALGITWWIDGRVRPVQEEV